MLKDDSTLLRILRSANNPRLKAKSEKNNQSIPKSSTILEGKCTCYLSEADGSIWIDLTAFSASTLFNSFIS